MLRRIYANGSAPCPRGLNKGQLGISYRKLHGNSSSSSVRDKSITLPNY